MHPIEPSSFIADLKDDKDLVPIARPGFASVELMLEMLPDNPA